MTLSISSIAPVLAVARIEPVLPFWVERLGFATTAEVPHEDHLGFVILEKDGTTVMYQTYDSLAADAPALGAMAGTAMLFVVVSDVDAVERAVDGAEVVVPRRRTFYGMDEIGVRDPAGHVILFAQPVADAAGEEGAG